MTPYYTDDQVTLYHGDCLDVLAELPDASVDAVITDPPYGLDFMGKKWDTGAVAFDTAIWGHALRLLKPGGHLLAFGGTRTWHRLAAAIEDAGFELRDSIAWLYGSGFPKSLDVSKAIDKAAGAEREIVSSATRGKRLVPGADAAKTDKAWHADDRPDYVHELTAPATDLAKQWQGWGTALKPAFEPIVVARKPLSGTVAANVVEHGTGAINIDACRVGSDVMTESRMTQTVGGVLNANGRDIEHGNWQQKPNDNPATHAGRWPTNVVIDEHTAAVLDEQTANLKTGGAIAPGSKGAGPRGNEVYGKDNKDRGDWSPYGDSGGASRFFPTFRYEAKAPTTERPTAEGVAHPTVKPLDLMRWLVRLVTPPHGLVLDPFAGSGTTAEACIREHMCCITIEREPDYLPLIMARLSKPMAVGFDFEEGA